MAGNYPDVPARRMPYDRDGTVGLLLDQNSNTVSSQLSTASLAGINDESSGGTVRLVNDGANPKSLCFLFPELRTLTAYALGSIITSNATISGIQYSPDSTNGIDGSWSSTGYSGSTATAVGMRTQIRSLALAGIRGLKFTSNQGFGIDRRDVDVVMLHLYGDYDVGSTPDRLRIWHPTLDQEAGGAYFDWGNVPRSSSADRQFRVKNNSSALTANNVLVSISAQTDTTPSVPSQHLFSTDGTTFESSVNVGSLAPGAISGVVTLRRVTPSNAVMSLWTARVLAAANSWT